MASDSASPPADQAPRAVHATAVVVRDAGVLIRGRSGHGKSSLALALIDLGRTREFHVRLVGDDRVLLQALNSRLIVRPHPAILGKIERRGSGVLNSSYQPHAVVRLVVDIVAANFECDIPPRMPHPAGSGTTVCGISIARMTLPSTTAAGDAAIAALDRLCGTVAPRFSFWRHGRGGPARQE